MEEMLHRVLEVNGVLAALLMSQDGLSVASANLDEDEADMIGALATAMVSNMRATVDRLAMGNLQALRLTTDIGMVEMRVIQELLLLVLCESVIDRSRLDACLEEATIEWLEFAL